MVDATMRNELRERLLRRGFGAEAVEGMLGGGESHAKCGLRPAQRKTNHGCTQINTDAPSQPPPNRKSAGLGEGKIREERVREAVREQARKAVEEGRLEERARDEEAERILRALDEKPGWYELFEELRMGLGFRESVFVAWAMQPKEQREPLRMGDLGEVVGLEKQAFLNWRRNEAGRLDSLVVDRKAKLGERWIKNKYDVEALFEYIVGYKRSHDGNSPSHRTIMREWGCSSTSVVFYLLQKLEWMGKVQLVRGEVWVVGGRWEY